jgi:hypothetical protein
MSTRVFTVEVTGCCNCPEPYYDEAYGAYGCGLNAAVGKEFKLYKQNMNAITESCPRYQQSFVKEEQIAGYIRARAEIAELKAKLAEVMPLAKLGAMTMKTESCLAYHRTGLLLNAFACGVVVDTDDVLSFFRYAPNIEATIEQLLED